MQDIDFRARCARAAATVSEFRDTRMLGRVAGLSGLTVEVQGLESLLAIGDRLSLQPRGGGALAAEVVGFRNGRTQALTFGAVDGLGLGAPVSAPLPARPATLAPGDDWVGRVIDPLGRPLNGRGPLLPGPGTRSLRTPPPPAAQRARLGPAMDFGVRTMNAFATCREGQRMGLFAGSGVGKSTLLGMLARDAGCDVVVLALVGERGREVREFLEDDLGPAGQARSVVVLATSDAP